QRIRTTQAEVGHVALALAGLEQAVDVVSYAEVQGEVGGNAEIVLNIEAPISPAVIGVGRVREPGAIVHPSKHELSKPRASQDGRRVLNQSAVKIQTER